MNPQIFESRVADALRCIDAIDWRRVLNYRDSPDLTCIRHHAFRPLITHIYRRARCISWERPCFADLIFFRSERFGSSYLQLLKTAVSLLTNPVPSSGFPTSSTKESTLISRFPHRNATNLLDPPDPFTIPNWAPTYSTTVSSFSPPQIPFYSLLHFTERTISYLEGLRMGLGLAYDDPLPRPYFAYRSNVFSQNMVIGFELRQEYTLLGPLRFNETVGLLDSLKRYIRLWSQNSPMSASVTLWRESHGGGVRVEHAVGRFWGAMMSKEGERNKE